MTPGFGRAGLGYVLSLPDVATEIRIGRVINGRDGVRARLRVMCALPGARTRTGNLYHGDFNLSSPTQRKQVAGYLAAQMSEISWSGLLEEFCDAVLTSESAGEPIVMVGRKPRRAIVDYVLWPIIPAHQATVIYGAGGTGKTTLAGIMGVSVATGHELIRGIRPNRGNVLVLDWERAEDDWNDLVIAIATGYQLESPDIAYRYCGGRTLADQVEEIARHVMDTDTRLLIIDSAGQATGSAREGADPSEATNKLYASLRAIKVAGLIIDHIAGENLDAERSVTKPYGSVYKINGSQGGVFELRREKSTGQVPGHLALIDTKRNMRAPLAPIGLRIEYEGDDPATSIRATREEIDSPELVRAAISLADRVERALKEAIVALDPKEITSAVGLNAEEKTDIQQVRNALNTYRNRRFRKLGDGRWGLATNVA